MTNTVAAMSPVQLFWIIDCGVFLGGLAAAIIFRTFQLVIEKV